MKITPESMKKQYEDLWNTFCKKNHDYGSSFEQSLDKHGLIAGVVRMEDKMNRISTLVDVDKNAEIASESLADTLRDLSNYSAMAACWLDGPDDVYNEENLQKIEDHLFGFDEAYARNFAKMTITHNGEDDSDDEYKLSNFEGHQEKVNEQEYFNGVLSDHTIIKNWGLVGDGKTVRSRTTGQYLVEDDNPELFRKIFGVLRAHYEVFEGQFNDIKELVVEHNKQSLKQWTDYCVDDVKKTLAAREQPSSTELNGLENGYVIRQHKNSHNSYSYTLAFNPEGTIKIEDDVEKPYVIECFSSDGVDSANVWAIHVFDTREDMVAALNYDLRVRRQFESKNLGYSIKGLDVKVSVFTDFGAPKVLDIWEDTFGEAFNNQMLSKDLNTEESIEKYHGIKTFGPVFISEKTGALVIKGTIREDSVKRPCDFIWFGDTKEVLLEVDHTIPKFNYDGIIYGVIYDDDKYVRYFNPLYDNMAGKIMYKLNAWSEARSELKNLVFFNEDEALESGNLTSKNNELRIYFTDSEAYWGESDKIWDEN